MSDYHNFSANDIQSYALPVFEMMSTTPFKLFAKNLGFIGDHDEIIKKISREFVQKVHAYIGIKRDKDDQNIYDETYLLRAWQALLQTIDNDNIFEWIQDPKVQKTVFLKRIDSPAWNSVFYKWAMDTKQGVNLEFDESLKQTIRICVMQLWLEFFHVDMAFPATIKHETLDDWDSWLLKLSMETWMIVRIRDQSRFTAWKNILKTLNTSQIEVFEKWGYDNMSEHDREFSFSLTKLNEDFRKHGYY